MKGNLFRAFVFVLALVGFSLQSVRAMQLDSEASQFSDLRKHLNNAEKYLYAAEGKFAATDVRANHWTRSMAWFTMREGGSNMVKASENLNDARILLSVLQENYGDSLEYQKLASEFHQLVKKFYYTNAEMQKIEIQLNNKGTPTWRGDRWWYNTNVVQNVDLARTRHYAEANHGQQEFLAKADASQSMKNPAVDRRTFEEAAAEMREAEEALHGSLIRKGALGNAKKGADFMANGPQWLGWHYLEAASEDLKESAEHLAKVDRELSKLGEKGYDNRHPEFGALSKRRDAVVKEIGKERRHLAMASKKGLPLLNSPEVLAYVDEELPTRPEEGGELKDHFASNEDYPDSFEAPEVEIGGIVPPPDKGDGGASCASDPLAGLRAENEALRTENETMKKENEMLRCQLVELGKQIGELRDIVNSLKADGERPVAKGGKVCSNCPTK